MGTKNVSLKKRIEKAHSKAKFAGFLYSLGSIILLAVLFLPIISVAQNGGPWALSALTFFKPFLALDLGLNYATLKNLPVAIVFLAMLLTALINMFKCFAQGKDLHKKNPTVYNGYNRPYFAMVAMGKTYSFTLWTIIVGYLGIYLTEATLSVMLVAIALGVALLIHFWAGLVGANINLYDVNEETIVESKREGSAGKHFLCNLIQVIAAAAIVYFYAVGTTVKELMRLLIQDGGVQKLTEISNLAPLLAQVLLLIFIVYIVKNATGVKEYLHDGIYTPGIRCFSTLCWFAAIIAAAWIAVEMVICSNALSTPALLIAAVAIIAALLDAATKLSKKALKAAEAEEAKKAAEEAAKVTAVPAQVDVKPASYKVDLKGISQPAVFLQPNGQPLMVMPMMAGSQAAPMYQQAAPVAPVNPADPNYAYAYGAPYANQTPVNNQYAPAYWGNGMPHGFYQAPVAEPTQEEAAEAPAEKADKKDAKNQKKLDKKAKAEKKKADKEAAAKKKVEAKKKAEQDAAAKKEAKAAKKAAKKKPTVEVLPTAVDATPEQPKAAPAPAELQPTPAPAVLAANVDAEEKKDEIVVPAGLPEGLPPYAAAPVTEEMLPPSDEADKKVKDEDRVSHEVVCPDCGKKLSVKDGAMAYRCPECGSVFQLQKTKKAI